MPSWSFEYGEATSGNPVNEFTGLELVGLDEDLHTFDLPADVTISDFFKTVLDDTTADAARATLAIGNNVLERVADDTAKTNYGRSFANPVGVAVYQVDTARAYICVSA